MAEAAAAGGAEWIVVPVVFFFQAEDGIRDGHVTGVQTCALPISRCLRAVRGHRAGRRRLRVRRRGVVPVRQRSEERRVGKECRSRWSPELEKKKKELAGQAQVAM